MQQVKQVHNKQNAQCVWLLLRSVQRIMINVAVFKKSDHGGIALQKF